MASNSAKNNLSATLNRLATEKIDTLEKLYAAPALYAQLMEHLFDFIRHVYTADQSLRSLIQTLTIRYELDDLCSKALLNIFDHMHEVYDNKSLKWIKKTRNPPIANILRIPNINYIYKIIATYLLMVYRKDKPQFFQISLDDVTANNDNNDERPFGYFIQDSRSSNLENDYIAKIDFLNILRALHKHPDRLFAHLECCFTGYKIREIIQEIEQFGLEDAFFSTLYTQADYFGISPAELSSINLSTNFESDAASLSRAKYRATHDLERFRRR